METVNYSEARDSAMSYLMNTNFINQVDILANTFGIDIEILDNDEILLEGDIVSDHYFDCWFVDFIEGLTKDSIIELYVELNGGEPVKINWEE